MEILTKQFKIGQEVVRSKGNYVVGRIGIIKEIDLIKNRAQVDWSYGIMTWVSFSALELTSVPYSIKPGYMNERKKYINPKYIKSV